MTNPADGLPAASGKAYDSEGNVVWTAQALNTLAEKIDALYQAFVENKSLLQTGAATSANQETIAALIGTLAAAAVTDPTLAATIIALLKGLLKQLQGSGNGATPVLFPDAAHRQVGNNSENNYRAGNSEEDNYRGNNTESGNALTDNTITGLSVAGNTMSGNNVSSNTVAGNTNTGNTFSGNQMQGINLNEFLDEVESRFRVVAQVTSSILANNIDDEDNPAPISCVEDDEGKAVMRVADAAPFAYDPITDSKKVTVIGGGNLPTGTFQKYRNGVLAAGGSETFIEIEEPCVIHALQISFGEDNANLNARLIMNSAEYYRTISPDGSTVAYELYPSLLTTNKDSVFEVVDTTILRLRNVPFRCCNFNLQLRNKDAADKNIGATVLYSLCS